MAKIVKIDSLSDIRIKHYISLTESQLRNRLEPEEGILIAESLKVIHTALEAGIEPISFLMPKKHISGQAAELLSFYPDVPVFTGEDNILEGITGYRLTRGILCAMKRPLLPSIKKVIGDKQRIAILENVVDSTNIGAIFRSAAALGMDGIVLSPNCCDPFNRRSIRVSMGSVFQVPWTYLSDRTDGFSQNGLKEIHANGYRIVAMALSNHTISIEDPILNHEEKLAIVMGSEGNGLSDFILDQCDETVTIPMKNNVDSLNVAAASAIAFWQLRKH